MSASAGGSRHLLQHALVGLGTTFRHGQTGMAARLAATGAQLAHRIAGRRYSAPVASTLAAGHLRLSPPEPASARHVAFFTSSAHNRGRLVDECVSHDDTASRHSLRRRSEAQLAYFSANAPQTPLLLSPATAAAPTRTTQRVLARLFATSLRRRAAASSSTSQAGDSSGAAEDGEGDKSMMGRLKSLTRKYGWATIAVYLLFSVVDFSLVFFAINLVGAEHVQRTQDVVLDYLVYGTTEPQPSREAAAEAPAGQAEQEGQEPAQRPRGQGVLGFLSEWRERHKQHAHELEAEAKAQGKKGGGSSGLWATAVLAYTIHKTLLLPFRLGMTAATTPAIVKQLQKWGLNIARPPIPKSVQAKGAQRIQASKERVDKFKERHKDWL